LLSRSWEYFEGQLSCCFVVSLLLLFSVTTCREQSTLLPPSLQSLLVCDTLEAAGVLSYMGYIGMFGPKGFGFPAVRYRNWPF